MAISVTKGRNTLLLTIVKELDREDVYNIHSELGKWLEESVRWDNQNTAPSGITFHNPAHTEAFQQAMSKRKFEEDMQEYIAKIKPTQHIEKELKTIELDPLNREVEVTKTKLKQNGKKGI